MNISKEEFKKWLEGMNPQTIIAEEGYAADNCAIANFIKSNYDLNGEPYITKDRIEIFAGEGNDFSVGVSKTPEWLTKFLEKADVYVDKDSSYKFKEITAERALEVINSI